VEILSKPEWSGADDLEAIARALAATGFPLPSEEPARVRREKLAPKPVPARCPECGSDDPKRPALRSTCARKGADAHRWHPRWNEPAQHDAACPCPHCKRAPAARRWAACCPKGHEKDLQLRRPADFKITGVAGAGDYLECEESEPESVDWEEDGTPGVVSGVWCPTCDEWYLESECLHACDDAGNPEIPSLGEDPPDEDDEAGSDER
jgi:hypothetical protein